MMFDFEWGISWYVGHLSKQRNFNGLVLLMLPRNEPDVQILNFPWSPLCIPFEHCENIRYISEKIDSLSD